MSIRAVFEELLYHGGGKRWWSDQQRSAGTLLPPCRLYPSFTETEYKRMLSMRVIAALLAGLLSASGAYAQTSLVDQSPETAKALKLSEEAVAAGKSGQAEALVAKAEEAKNAGITAQKNFTSFNLQSAVTLLSEAIAEGKKGDTTAATAKAQAAVDVLKSSSPEDANLP
jgi:hypothetical protein